MKYADMENKESVLGNTYIDRFERLIAILYCCALPYRLLVQLSVLKNIFGVCANYSSFLFHVIGILLWIYNENGTPCLGRKRHLIANAGYLVLYLNTSSLIMACFIQAVYGNHGSENAFQGVFGMIVYFLQYFLMFIYNYRVFQLVSLENIRKILHINCICLLVIGYMQILVMNNIGGSLYDTLNVFKILNDSTHLPKLCLTGTEGATAGQILGVFVFPFLYSLYIKGNKLIIIEILLWIIPTYYTKSATVYLVTIIDVSIFLIICVFKDKKDRGYLLLFFIIAIISFLIILQIIGVLDKVRVEEIRYLLFDKARDYTGNGSTASRTVPLVVSWGAFKEYPLLGVGNGLQGYFYEKYFPEWAYHVEGSDVKTFLNRSRSGIGNAGVFIPGLLSGYGVVGCTFIALFFKKIIWEANRMRKDMNYFFFAYIISMVAIVFLGFSTDYYGAYFVWFFFSLPLIEYNGTKEYKVVTKPIGRYFK